MANTRTTSGINSLLKEFFDEQFGDYAITLLNGGATNANLYALTSSTGENYIIKKQVTSLENEYRNYKWLEEKVPVPKVLLYKTFDEFELLCVTRLKGDTLEYYIDKLEVQDIISRYAGSLRWLHSLETDDNCLVQSLDSRLLQAKYKVSNHLVNRSDFDPANQQYEPAALYRKLLQIKPLAFTPVYTHGDYCLDNIIFDDDRLSGFIDLSNGGLADQYQDIAIAVRSIREYFDEQWVNFFYKEYGLLQPDENRLSFYTLLDEFF